MLDRENLVALGKALANADKKAPIAYSFEGKNYNYEALNETFRQELNEMVGTPKLFNQNKYEMFELLEEVIDDFEGADKVAKKLALENKKLNQGIQILADNWDDWKEALKDSTSPKYYEALTDIQNAMEDIFGIKPDASFI